MDAATTTPSTSKSAWHANWIWPAGGCRADQWAIFRKRVELPAAPTAAVARIAADTKYWLWVNGELIVREGGLKRGPNPRDTYFDTVELAGRLHPGQNTVAVLVWYWGRRPNYSHNDSGLGGLLFDCVARTPVGDVALHSDASWRAVPHPAFRHVDAELPWQSPMWPVVFDARLEPLGWQRPDFHDGAMPDAAVLGAPPCEPWNELAPRPIPFWRDHGLRDFENAAELTEQYSLEPGCSVTLAARLPYNAQFTPAIELEAPAGVVVRMATDTHDQSKLFVEYVTSAGAQRWESPLWINGDELNVTLAAPPDAPAEVVLRGLQFRETGIDAEFAGRFECDDAAVNRLWHKSVRTTYLCIRDNYMDCPDREQAQWWGDAVNEILQTLYAFDTKAHASIAKAIREVFAWQRPDGVLAAPAPHCAAERSKELPTQMQAGVWIVWQYYLYTGDAGVLSDVAPAIRRWLHLWETRKDAHGLYEPAGGWLWFDWGEKPLDGKRICNFLHCIVLAACAKIAAALDDAEWAGELVARHATHFARCLELLWDGASYGPDDRANALATLASLVDMDRREGVLRVLTDTLGASPYMERFCEEALCLLGRADLAVARMKRRYAENLASDSSTLYEMFPLGGTKNHAWGGGPMYIASAYLAGLRPTEPGWARFLFAPQPGPLARFDCAVPTVRGEIVAAMRQGKDGVVFSLSNPKGTLAEIGLPLPASGAEVHVGQSVLWRGGKPAAPVRGLAGLRAEDGRLWLEATPGDWEFRVVRAV